MTVEIPAQNGSVDTFRYTWPITGVDATLERFDESRDGLSAEFTIIEAGTGALLHSARLNIMASTTRATLVKALGSRRTDIDWGALIEQVCYLAKERYREGEPLIDLRDVVVGSRPRWYLEPYVEQSGATILFADGGSGKSIIAMALAVLAATGEGPIGKMRGEPKPVIYLDWEADPHTHAERLGALCLGHSIKRAPPIYYRRQSASLVEAAPIIKKDVERIGAGLVIVDAMGAARSGDPVSAELTIKTFNAARAFGVPWIGVDHVPKGTKGLSIRGHARPFGSTYTHDMARVTWSLERDDDEMPDGGVAISMVNHKANNGRLANNQGWKMHYEMQENGEDLRAVQIERMDIRDSPGLVKNLPMRERILAFIHNQDGSHASEDSIIGALSNHNAKKDDSPQIRARISELRKFKKIVKLSSGDFGIVGV